MLFESLLFLFAYYSWLYTWLYLGFSHNTSSPWAVTVRDWGITVEESVGNVVKVEGKIVHWFQKAGFFPRLRSWDFRSFLWVLGTAKISWDSLVNYIKYPKRTEAEHLAPRFGLEHLS